MADTKISGLTSGSALADADVFPAVETTGVGPVKKTAAQIKTYAQTGVAKTANNLSDLGSASTARTNLGLGSAATLTAGTSAYNLVQLDASANLPALDGTVLTGIPKYTDKLSTFATTSSTELATVINGKTGTGNLVFAASPTLTSPTLGNATATTVNKLTFTQPASGATLTLADGSTLAVSGAYGITLTATGTTTLTLPTSGTLATLNNTLGAFAATSSAQLASVINDETGSGALVFASSPTLITPNLGTPSAATLTNATGLPISTGVSGLGTGVATFLGTPSCANLASIVTSSTGSGALVFGTAPTLGSPVLTGTATFNGATSGTVAVKAPSVAGTTTFTLPGSNGTSGYVLVTDGLGNTSWAVSGGAAGNAAGVDKNIQFNDSGNMAGNAGFNFDKTTDTVSIGVASTTTGKLSFYNASSANATTIQGGNASAAVTYTLPTADGTNGQALITNGSGALSWTTVASGLVVGTSAVSGGTSGRILYDNAGTLGEKAVTGSGDVVLATSPTLVTPALGTPASGNFSSGTFTWPTFNQNTTGTAAGLSSTLAVASGGTGLTSGTSGGVLYYSASGTLASSAALAANAIVIGGGAGVAPSTTTTGTGILTFLGTPSSANLAAAVTDETGTGSLVFSTAPTFGTNITIGAVSSSTGILNFKGTTSGTVALSVADAAGTWTMKLPTTAGSNNQALTTDGSGNTTWTTITGGATGGGSDAIFWNNGQTINNDYTVPSTTNAGTFGPVTIAATKTVTISSGSNWVIV